MGLWLGIGLLSVGLLIINAAFAYQAVHVEEALSKTALYHLKVLPFFYAANLMVGIGIRAANKAATSLTFSLSLAKGIELAICVLIGWSFMRETPTWRTAAGLGIVLIGFIVMKWKPAG
ncbi:hypothetical protein [Paenibacillus xylaniclasticus]|uniref:hypothetical protein n=1 Tax=Paenibacillus xylaniclasticus TaxID=588083 RepID=UPI000FD74A99|nr:MULTISPECIES: hypothetical protein [Paenibacillus]GFN33533.1 hypothetical protein PCURB6_37930 [Paenibacillus curdlanolyticus]